MKSTVSMKEFLEGRSKEDHELLLQAAVHLNRLSQEAYQVQSQQAARAQVSRWWSVAPLVFIGWSLGYADIDSALYALGAIIALISGVILILSMFSWLRAAVASAQFARAMRETNKMSFHKFAAHFPPAHVSVAKQPPYAATLEAPSGEVILDPHLMPRRSLPQYFKYSSTYPAWSPWRKA